MHDTKAGSEFSLNRNIGALIFQHRDIFYEIDIVQNGFQPETVKCRTFMLWNVRSVASNHQTIGLVSPGLEVPGWKESVVRGKRQRQEASIFDFNIQVFHHPLALGFSASIPLNENEKIEKPKTTPETNQLVARGPTINHFAFFPGD